MNGDFAEAVHYLAAIRLAIEGAADDGTALTIIESILTAGPQCEPSDIWPTRLLVTAIQENRAQIVVPGVGAPSTDPAYDSWSGGGADASTPLNAHACNCIGCCPKCGTCRTWHGHTPAYCALLQRQALARAEATSC